MVFYAALLSTQHYKVWIKSKVQQPREQSSALHLGVVAIEKRAFGSPSTKVTNFTYSYISVGIFSAQSDVTIHVQHRLLQTVYQPQSQQSRVTRRLPFRQLLHQGVGEGATPFPGLLHFTLEPYLIMLSVKQGGIKYHF